MAVSKVNEQDEKEFGTEQEKEVGEAKAKPDLQHDQKDVVVVEANNATPDDTVDQVTAALKVKPKKRPGRKLRTRTRTNTAPYETEAIAVECSGRAWVPRMWLDERGGVGKRLCESACVVEPIKAWLWLRNQLPLLRGF